MEQLQINKLKFSISKLKLGSQFSIISNHAYQGIVKKAKQDKKRYYYSNLSFDEKIEKSEQLLNENPRTQQLHVLQENQMDEKMIRKIQIINELYRLNLIFPSINGFKRDLIVSGIECQHLLSLLKAMKNFDYKKMAQLYQIIPISEILLTKYPAYDQFDLLVNKMMEAMTFNPNLLEEIKNEYYELSEANFYQDSYNANCADFYNYKSPYTKGL